ncbi:MAG: CehA/McbA family metallohydrolase [Polyangiaceae bacterium]
MTLWIACQPSAEPQTASTERKPASVALAGFELGVAPSPAGELRAGYRLRPAEEQHGVYLMPLLQLGGSLARVVRIHTDGDKETLSFVQRASGCELKSDARLVAAKPPYLDLSLRARCSKPERVRLGWRVDWPGRQSFVPGLGFATRGHVNAEWVGRRTRTGAFALASKQPSDIELVAEHVGHLGVVSWGTEARLAAGEVREERHRLILDSDSLASAARSAWQFSGRELGTLSGSLMPAPKWAVLEARNPANQLIVASRAHADGSWQLSLPPGNYTIQSKTPGGTDELQATISAGSAATLNLVPPTPGQLELRALGEDKKPIPARWILRGVGETPDPVLNPQSELNAWMLFTLNTSEKIAVPAGDYQVTATHGPEYGLFQQRVHVEAERGAVIRATLRKQLDLSGWVPSDFHLHQAPSFDSEVRLEDRLTSLLSDGIRFAAATDHNVVTDYAPTLSTLAPSAELGTTPGVEITTRDWGHFNAFPYGKKSPPSVKERSPEQIFGQVRQDQPQAVLQVNHPRMGDIGYFNRGKLDLKTGDAESGFSYDFDTIEVFNGFDLGNPGAVQQCLESWYGLLNNGWRFTAVGNSDSHKLVGEYAGYPRTYVAIPDGTAVSETAIAAGLKAGRAWVSNGPELEVSLNGAGPGQHTSLTGGNQLRIVVSTADFVGVNRVQLVINGAVVVEQRFPEELRGGKRELNIPLELVDDSWLVVLVRGDTALEAILPGIDAKPLAFTNPIFVDVDGDGKFTARHAEVRERHEQPKPPGSSLAR